MAVLSNTSVRAGASAAGDSGYKVEKSIRFEDTDSACLKRTPSSSGDQQKWTLSFWFKRPSTGSATHFFSTYGSTNADDSYFRVWMNHLGTFHVSFWAYYGMTSTEKFRDPAAWYHAVVVMDSTQATTTDRCKVWINGNQINTTGVAYPTQNNSFGWNANIQSMIGNMTTQAGATSSNGNSYMAEVYNIDGQALDPSSFGETDATTGKWVPKEYTGTYGPTIDQRDTWSDHLSSANGFYSGAEYQAIEAFDGDLNSFGACNATSGDAVVYTHPIAETITSLEFRAHPQSYTITLPDSSTVTVSGVQDTWVNVTLPSGGITFNGSSSTLSFGGGNWHYLDGIKFNGKELIDDTVSIGDNSFYLKFNGTDPGEDSSGNDNDWTAVNLTTSQLTTVSAATGGLPIYNTSGDLGGTKESGYRTDSSAGTTDGTGLVLAIPGDTTTDVHASINTGSSTKTLSTTGTVSTSTAKSKFYGTSIDMTSTTAADHWTTAASSDFNFGTGDYTIEWWHYWNDATGYQSIFDCGYTDTGGIMLQSYSGSAAFWVYISGSVVIQEQLAGAANLQEWTHYALVRNGTTLTLYRNGIDIGNATSSVSTGLSDHDFHIGSDEHDYYIRGYIQDFRVYKGVAKYTSAFSVTKPEATDIDVSPDTPTDFNDDGNGTGNYCTLNPLSNALALSQGNLKATQGSAAHERVHGTFAKKTGKWYWEVTKHDNAGTTSGTSLALGVANTSNLATSGWITPKQHFSYLQGGATYYDDDTYPATTASASVPGGSEHSAGVWMFAFDFDNGKGWLGKDGTWLKPGGTGGDPAAGTDPIFTNFTSGDYYTPLIHVYEACSVTANFGQRAFAYTPPTGYKVMNTYNIPDPVITDPSKYFDTKLYTGTGASHAITGLNFSPDLVWIKKYTTASHAIFDTVRGAEKRLQCDGVLAEETDNTTLTAFGTEGFTLSTHDDVNQNTDSYVAWNWDAGSSNTSVSAGGLNSTVYDQRQTWASYGSFDDHYATANSISYFKWEDVFSSELMNNSSGSLYVGSTTADVWTPTAAISVSSTIKFYTDHPTKVVVNAGLSDETTATSTGANFHYHEFSFSGNITTISVAGVSGTNDCYFMGLWIDGKQLCNESLPTIASTYRANPNVGFSIVSYEGTGSAGTFAHGLNAKPSMVIIKITSAASYAWKVIHEGMTGFGTYMMDLNLDSSESSASASWFNSLAPDSNIVNIGTVGPVNLSGEDYVAYCWSEVEGYSKFGSFTGNGSTDGPFIWCGFKPAWIMFKRKNMGYGWNIYDSKRDPYNETDVSHFHAEATTAHADGDEGAFDMLSNGFKMKGNWNINNASGGEYIYAAFADTPFKYANAR